MSTDFRWLEPLLEGPEPPTRASVAAAAPVLAVPARSAAADMMFDTAVRSLRSLAPALDATSPGAAQELQALAECRSALLRLIAGTLGVG